MSESRLAPIFVIGTPRSGTTLTAKILGNHRKLFMPGETHFFDDIHSRAKRLGIITNDSVRFEVAKRLYTLYERYDEPDDQRRIISMFPSVHDLADALKGCRDYGEVFGRFMDLQMREAGMMRWGNNAPRDLFSALYIRRYFPDAKLIICVRDIRAFLYSYKGKWKVIGEEYVERFKKLYHPVVTSYLWKSSMRQLPRLEKLFAAENRIVVRYEDLVTEPEQTVRRICATIGEDFEPSMLNVNSHNSSDATECGGIFASSIDRWKKGLSPEEIYLGQAIGSLELKQLGYEVIHIDTNLLRLVNLWLTAPIALMRALYVNREARGPLVPYLYRRLVTLFGAGRV